MKKQFLHLILAAFVCPVTIFAQPNNIVPVSPEAAALTKMVDYPINMNTGVPDISIPFYEINVGGLKLPVALQYHAGGFKINEQATRAGLGWSLSSDLQITRTVNGLDDFKTLSGYLANNLVKTHYPSPSPCPDCSYPRTTGDIYSLATGAKDGSPDRFTYSLLGKSGSFYFQKDHSGTGYSIVPVPFDNIKIQYIDGAFVITDTDGTVYYFGESGTALTISELGDKGIETSGPQGWAGTFTNNQYRSAWKCKRIVNNTGTDEITFNYVRKQESRFLSYTDRVEYYNNENPCSLISNGYYTSNEFPFDDADLDYEDILNIIPFHRISSPKYFTVFGASNKAYFHVPYLDGSGNVVDVKREKENYVLASHTGVTGLSVSEISFRGGKITFDGVDKLNSVRLVDHNNVEKKALHFFQSFTTPANLNEARYYNGMNFQGTLYLDSLHIRSGTETYERYAFYYENKFCFGNHLKGHDVWGYPNDNTMEIYYANNLSSNNSSLPTTHVMHSRFFGTGCYDFANNVFIKIGDHDHAQAPSRNGLKRGVLKRIEYPTGGYTDFDFEPNQYTEDFTGSHSNAKLPQISGGLRIRAINQYDSDGKHKSQKYYRYGMLEEGSGILVNKPERTKAPNRFHYGAVSYEQQMVYLRSVNASPNSPPCSSSDCLSIFAIEKKTTFEPASVLSYTYSSGAPIYYQKVTEYQQDFGQQVGKVVHEYYSPGHFYQNLIPLSYGNRFEGTDISPIKAEGLMGHQKSITRYKPKLGHIGGYELVNRKEFEYQRYVKPGWIRVIAAFVRNIYTVVEGNYQGQPPTTFAGSNFLPSTYYPGDDFIVNEYGLPSARVLLSKMTETNYEDGNMLQETSEYTYSNLPYLQPTEIKTWDSKGNEIITSNKYAYDYLGTTVYDGMVNANMISQLIEEYVVNSTSGIEVSRKKTNYAIFPIATGITLPASIQSSIYGAPLRTELTFDSYDSYGNITQMTKLDGLPITYLWGYQNLYLIAALEGVAYSQVSNTYKSHSQITNPVDDELLQQQLNGLRSDFPSAKVTTYSYKPLIGQSIVANEDGLATYYEYDGIGRLRLIKDHNKHVLNRYTYHTRGPGAVHLYYMNYTNVPVMRTHVHEESPGAWKLYNRYVAGGTFSHTGSQYGADFSARSEADTPVPPNMFPPGPGSSNMARIELNCFTNIFVPSEVEVDILDDDGIFATFRYFGAGVWAPYNTVYLPAGVYRLSLRVKPDINYSTTGIETVFLDPIYGTEIEQGVPFEVFEGDLFLFEIHSMAYPDL